MTFEPSVLRTANHTLRSTPSCISLNQPSVDPRRYQLTLGLAPEYGVSSVDDPADSMQVWLAFNLASAQRGLLPPGAKRRVRAHGTAGPGSRPPVTCRPPAGGLPQISGRFIPHRPEEPVLGKRKARHRLFTAVREAKARRAVPFVVCRGQESEECLPAGISLRHRPSGSGLSQ